MIVKQQLILTDCVLFARLVLTTTTIILTTSNDRTFTRCQLLLFVLYCIRLEFSQLLYEVGLIIIILIL